MFLIHPFIRLIVNQRASLLAKSLERLFNQLLAPSELYLSLLVHDEEEPL